MTPVATDRSPVAVLREEAPHGVVAGVVSWVVSYAGAVRVAGWLFGRMDAAWGGLVLYNAHLVPLASVGGVTDASGNALIQMLGTTGLAVAALPAFLLLVAGIGTGWASGVRTRRDGAVAGLTVAAGYLPLSTAGALLFTGRLFGGVYRPSVLPSVVVMGLVLPGVLGAVGGVIGREFRVLIG